MIRLKHHLLTTKERDQMLAILTDWDSLVRLYTFEASDLDIIGSRRRRRTQMGVAVQLALLRHPGTTLAQFVQDVGSIPSTLASFVAEHLELSGGDLADYAAREQTMTDHARDLMTIFGLRAPASRYPVHDRGCGKRSLGHGQRHRNRPGRDGRTASRQNRPSFDFNH